MDADQIAEYRVTRLKDAIQKFAGGNVSAFGRAMGLKDGAYIRQMSAGTRPISEKTIREIEKLFKCEGWFSPVTATAVRFTDGTGIDIFDDGNTLRIPVLANSASMGGGSEALHEDVVTGALQVSPSWVTQRIRPTRPENLRIISAYGDSMSPTFEDGDVLLIDTGVREAKINGVYVIRAHDRLFVKRVSQQISGQFVISSDNPSERTVEVLNGGHEVDIIGRVVWCWNGRKI